jgi:hypothetical protein
MSSLTAPDKGLGVREAGAPVFVTDLSPFYHAHPVYGVYSVIDGNGARTGKPHDIRRTRFFVNGVRPVKPEREIKSPML